MNVLLASSTLNVKNGYGNITHELVTALRDGGFNVTLLLPKEDEFSQYDIAGVYIERVLPRYLFSYKSKAILEHLLWRYKTNKKFDLVHSLFEFPYAPLLSREAKRLKIPFIMGAQGTYGVKPLAMFPEKYFMKHAYRSARAIIVPSEYTKNAILREAGEKYKIDVIHNGVNFKRFANHKIIDPNFAKQFEGKKIILTVGEVKSRKGQDLVIRALPEVVKRNPDVLYVMVGYPSAQETLEKLADECGVSEYVHFTGPVNDTQILDYFHLCDVYVHTPRVHNRFQFEGFGIVYLEAGACGKPSVAADAGGIRDAVVDGETGFVAGNENVEEIAEKLNTLLADEDLKSRMGKKASEYAKEHDWANVSEKYICMYNSVLSNVI